MDNRNTIPQCNNIPDLLNQKVIEWCNQYDTPPALNAHFTANTEGYLVFNGYTLGVYLSEIVVSSIYKDIQWFGFSTIYGEDFDFKICWPFGKNTTPSVEYIRRSIPKAK